ncbi:MAG: hypothetical protein EBS01_06975 [Verrucomicrobia bacterium]|nr:hypothetical protein [Verrucomicrobiota bacterium]
MSPAATPEIKAFGKPNVTVWSPVVGVTELPEGTFKVNLVSSVTEATVVPAGIPSPVINIPTPRTEVSLTVTVVTPPAVAIVAPPKVRTN